MRLIDADEAIINFGFEWDDIPPTIEEFVRFLKKQPTVDAGPVVRCRDCKHWHKDTVFCGYMSYGEASERVNWYADDFCSYGERKDGDGNG